jgi:tetratricopeptide (TPR) repeat protein
MMKKVRNAPFILSLLFIVVFLMGDIPAVGVHPCFASEDLYKSRLDKGLFNTEPYSYLLMEMARADREGAGELLQKAKKYSPDLPAVYFAFGRESLSPSPSGIFQGFDYFRQGMKAYGRNFWWEFNLAGLIYISLIISCALSLFVVLAIRFPLETALLLHDGVEERRKLFLLLIPLFLSLLGPIAFIAGIFFIIGFYFKRENKALVYVSLLFFLSLPVLQKGMDIFLSAPPALKAIADVNEGKENLYALRTLKGRGDFASLFSYALAEKREGNYQDAIDAYKRLVRHPSPSAPSVYVNLGNTYYAAGDIDAALDAYRKSIEIVRSPLAFYNLSQVYRGMLDFEKGDEYFLEAAKLSPESVSRYASVTGMNPNRFVVDDTLPMSALWEYALSMKNSSFSPLPFVVLLIAAVLIPGFYLLDKKMKYQAHRCRRCGEVFCMKCSRTLAWGEMCPSCYQSFIKIDEVDSKERVTRLLSIYQTQTKRRKETKLLSYLIPGAGQIYSGKLLLGLLIVWPFLFAVTLLVMSNLPIMRNFPFTHGWILPLSVMLMGITYTVSVLYIRRRIHRGWL